MTQKSKEKVMNYLQRFVDGSDFKVIEKSKPKIAAIIKKIKPEDLVFGDDMSAKFTVGHFNGNVRSEGRKSNGDITQTRTVNFDFTTKPIGFISADNTATPDAFYYAAQLKGMHTYNLGVAKFSNFNQLGEEIYEKKNTEFALIRNVFPACEYEHDKLGYYLDSSTIKILQAEYFEEARVNISICSIHAVYFDDKGKEKQLFLGYYACDEESGSEYTIIDVEPIIGKRKKEFSAVEKKKVSLGKIIGFIIGACIVVYAVIKTVSLLNMYEAVAIIA